MNAYSWDLEKWYWWTCLQERIRDTDIEKRFVDTAGGGEGGMNWKSGTDLYSLAFVKQRASGEAVV